jgi:hypothetical protein
MDTTAQRMLAVIAETCPQSLRPEDWQRLYRFSLYAHTHKLALRWHIVGTTLMQHGCSVEQACVLEDEIQHFMELLKLYDEYREESD